MKYPIVLHRWTCSLFWSPHLLGLPMLQCFTRSRANPMEGEKLHLQGSRD